MRTPIWKITDPEERFQTWLERSANYNATIEAAGDTPWHGGDVDRRRELFMRRFTKPAPPAGLFVNPEEIRR
ncbi:hypothetical protein B7435_23670 [Mycolicibacterium peregrinum]|uniref:hypothetical protein n=1 Tax=Mycolicibacterium peregrinum TaxID=43304 RepID=UPI000B4ABB1B|nr:hypothetical protein [Mycolicibacterium peregrinum]MCP3811379.1 hypothetical protein [Mycobacteriaceae bacterium Msp059]OWL98897.1 hypothetical protein B7435_23670 [Mycolicibacterium peregrinum]